MNLRAWFKENKNKWWFIGLIWLIDFLFGSLIIFFYQTVGFTFLNVLEGASYIGTCFAAGAVVVAVMAYKQQKRNDDTRLIYDLLEDFKRIEKLRREIRDEIEILLPNYFDDSKSKSIPDLTLSSYAREFPERANAQLEIFISDPPKPTQSILDSLLLLSKELEGFSAVIINSGLEDHPLLESVQTSFAVLIEQHALYILTLDAAERRGEKNPDCTLKLYDKWKSKVIRDSSKVLERELQRAGFNLRVIG